MNRIDTFVGALAIALAAATAHAEVEDVKSPRGETVRILVEKADSPFVTVVLFAGGDGGLEMSKAGEIHNLKGNFLLRTRRHFRSHGANTVVIDAPSDRHSLREFRDTEGHARDVGAVIRHLKATLKLPVWVIGTSNGTTSAANAGVRLAATADRPDGVVLTSTRMATTAIATGVPDLDLARITGPVLIAHHKSDSCFVTPPERMPGLQAALKNAKPVKVLWYEGGSGIKGDACEAYHYHGFRGIETTVIADIMAWIRNPAP
ncbi:MAG: alpha/beta hydrolase [Rhodospirillales bacterium]|nr:alpha/beta hydrolase [Rhodospirillales bacterium]